MPALEFLARGRNSYTDAIDHSSFEIYSAGHTTLYNKKPGISAKKQQISRVGKENHG